MKKPLISKNEDQRQKKLDHYQIVDTLPEQTYDDLTFLASLICDTPIALVTLIDKDRQWFKSNHGLEIRETPRAISFCGHAIHNDRDKLFLVQDALQDNRFADNPLVTENPGIRFYAGVPLINKENFALGTLCVIDSKPRELNKNQKAALRTLGRQVMHQIESRKITNYYERIVDSVGGMLFEVDIKGNIIFANETILNRTGYKREEFIGRNFTEFVYPADRKTVVEYYRTQLLKAKSKTDFTFRAISKSGEVKWVSQNVEMHFNQHNRLTKSLVTLRDITKEKHYELELLESKEKLKKLNASLEETVLERTKELQETRRMYEELYHTAPDMMLSVNPYKRTIINCNDTAVNLLGYKREELIGKRVFFIFHEDSFAAAKKGIKQFKETGELKERKLYVKTKDERKIPVLLTASAVKNSNGEIIHSNSVLKDISALSKAENELKKLNIELEERVKERTKQLEQVNEDLENFAYITTHDLKSPLVNIKGHTNILQNELKNDDNKIVSKALDWIIDSIKLAESRIESIMEVAKLKQSAVNLIEEINVIELCREVEKELDTLVKMKDIDFKMVTNEVESISFNKVHLKSILLNLIHNSIKYKRKNTKPEVVVTFLNKAGKMTISVKDNGLGFDLKKQSSKLFSMFGRLHDHVEGKGMALYLAKRIMENASGSIEVESELGVGTIFTLNLP